MLLWLHPLASLLKLQYIPVSPCWAHSFCPLYQSSGRAEIHSCSFSSHHCFVAFALFDPALARCPLAWSACPAVPEQPGRAPLPGVKGFRWPDPHAWCDANKQGHEDSKHFCCYIRVLGAGPELPPVRELVEVTANDSGRWDGIQNRKHSDLHH